MTKKKGKIQNVYRLAPMQSGMLYHSLRDKEKDNASDAYFQQVVFYIEGNVDPLILERSFNVLVQRYDILRTAFIYEDQDEPLQVVLKEREIRVYFQDISGMEQEEKEHYFETFRKGDEEKGFDLSKNMLMRIALFKTGNGSYRMMLSFHHILMDGWCLGIVFKEFLQVYWWLSTGRAVALEPAVPYVDYIKWLDGQDKDEALRYWREELTGYDHRAGLPKISLGSEGNRYKTEEYTVVIDEKRTEGLQRIAAECDATVSSVMQALWGILLQRYNNTGDVVYGVVVSGRPSEIPGIEKIVGLFINTVPLRVTTTDEYRFSQLVGEMHRKAIAAKSYEYLPLAEVQANSLLKSELIDHIIVFENYPVEEELKGLTTDKNGQTGPGFTIENIAFYEHTHYDLSILIVPGKSLSVAFSFNSLVHDGRFIKRTASHMEEMIRQILDDPGKKVIELEIMPEEEKRLILYEFNNTELEFPKDRTIHRLFEEQVERTPDGRALEGSAGLSPVSYTYAGLNETANRLARRLRAKGIRANTLAALMTERSPEMMAGILGILKAGGAYLPIDPQYPPERVSYILDDSGTELLLVQDSFTPGDVGNIGGGNSPEIVKLDDTSFSTNEAGNLEPVNSSKDLIYVIYTSGSTGNPKGVMVEHRSAVNRLNWMQRFYPIEENDVLLQKTPFIFDVSVWEIFWWGIQGASLYILSPGYEKDPGKIIESVALGRVTTIHFVPSMLNAFLQYIEDQTPDKLSNVHALSSLVRVFASGEALTPGHAERFNRLLNRKNNTKLINLYGPTEATVDVSYYNCSNGEKFEKIPIGKPIDNTCLLIVDKDLRLQPPGVAGELGISGIGLARGYINKPELTGTKFIPNPFEEGKRLYLTGDIARWIWSGDIEFLGRGDYQVKIRGFRIELGEIENRLSKHEEIGEAVVIVREDESGDKFLCAYVTLCSNLSAVPSRLTGPHLKDYLSGKLPDYMIPLDFIIVENIPLTPTGKVDRKKLSLLSPGIRKSAAPYAAPRDPGEIKLIEIWARVLGVEKEKIGIDSNFLELGGHSLKATVLALRIHKEFNVKISLDQVFKTPTIRELARFIGGKEEDTFALIKPAEKKDYYRLSSAQKRLNILQQLDPHGTVYNIPQAFFVEGELKREQWEDIFKKLIRRHESLRTSFEIVDGVPVQRIHDHVTFEIQYYDMAVEDTIRDFVKPFNLLQPPLLRVGIIKEEERKHILLVDMHHIISDGVSHGLLLRDVVSLCLGVALPDLVLQYTDYSEWQNREREKGVLNQQGTYWRETFSGEIPILNLPTDFPRPKLQDFAGNAIEFTIDEDQTRLLKKMAVDRGATLFILLLAVYHIFLGKLSGQEDIVIGTPIANRRHTDLEQIIGMFVNTLALRNHSPAPKEFTTFLAEVKERAFTAFENQDYPFEELVEQVAVARDTGRNPLFDVMLVLQNIDVPSAVPAEEIRQLKFTPYPHGNRTAKFDLTLNGEEAAGALHFNLEYCTALFRARTIERFINYFKRIVTLILKDSRLNISEIELIPEREKQQILKDFNDTEAVYPDDKTLQQLFAEQVEKTPNNTALVGAEGVPLLSYKELNEKSNQLARQLKEKGVIPGSIVAIEVGRSLATITGILGILKAGGAYLPVDPDYPEERIKYMLADSNATVLLKKSEIRNPKNIPIVSNFEFRASNLHDLSSSNLAYVIYTSGSTGRPKGVLVEHRSVVNLLIALFREYPLTEADGYLLKTSFLFDVSVSELFGWFTGGGRLVILEENGEKDPGKIIDTIGVSKVTHINFVPSMFNVFVEALNPGNIKKLSGLKYIFLAGEPVGPQSVITFRQLNNSVRLENLYGPTEGTVYSCKYPLAHWDNTGDIPIGKSLQNVRHYILDGGGHLQPIGVSGELHIAGQGVARGYLNRPELTNEKFNHDLHDYRDYHDEKQRYPQTSNKKFCGGPGGGFSKEPPGCRRPIYKTGDLARWQWDGNIQFLGRVDQQVKIRGFRIEPEEIENHLRRHETITEAVVMVKENEKTGKKLYAYIVLDKSDPSPVDVEEALSVPLLREYLAGGLPDYMIPADFVVIDRLPLTPGGKLDRRALDSGGEILGTGVEYVAPQNKIGKQLAEIWTQVLDAKKVGIHDNFFDLGGNSLKVIQVSMKINELLGMEIPMVTMFEYPTIRSFLNYLDREKAGNHWKDKEIQRFDSIRDEAVDLMEQSIRLMIGDEDE